MSAPGDPHDPTVPHPAAASAAGPDGDAIRVSAVVMAGPDGRVLTVRKAGTAAFMFPGGKHEPGERPLDTAVRETGEETGLRLRPEDLVHLGAWDVPAANEPGRSLHAEVFGLRRPLAPHEVPEPSGEIAERHWMDPASPAAPEGSTVAPLLGPVLARVAAHPLF